MSPRQPNDYTAAAAATADQAKRSREAAARVAGHYTAEDERQQRQARRNGIDFADLDELAARQPGALDKLPPHVRMAAGYAAADRARRDGTA